eukprot:355187-Chlamydomonas_euryale.AAC.1
MHNTLEAGLCAPGGLIAGEVARQDKQRHIGALQLKRPAVFHAVAVSVKAAHRHNADETARTPARCCDSEAVADCVGSYRRSPG